MCVLQLPPQVLTGVSSVVQLVVDVLATLGLTPEPEETTVPATPDKGLDSVSHLLPLGQSDATTFDYTARQAFLDPVHASVVSVDGMVVDFYLDEEEAEALTNIATTLKGHANNLNDDLVGYTYYWQGMALPICDDTDLPCSSKDFDLAIQLVTTALDMGIDSKSGGMTPYKGLSPQTWFHAACILMRGMLCGAL